MYHLVQDIEWLQGKKMRQIHLKANSRRSKHFFFHYLYQHNFIITRQFFSRMENIKNNFNFPSNDYSSSPEWTLKYSALQKKLSDNCFLSRNLCSHHIKSLCCYAPPPPASFKPLYHDPYTTTLFDFKKAP